MQGRLVLWSATSKTDSWETPFPIRMYDCYVGKKLKERERPEGVCIRKWMDGCEHCDIFDTVTV